MRHPNFEEKSAINEAFSEAYKAGVRSGKHGFYETCYAAMHQAYAKWLDGSIEPVKVYAKDELEAMRFKGN